jgi:ADP-ribose pyrophosphatase YjhB (NUDIX family)
MPDVPASTRRAVRVIALGVVVQHDHLLVGPVLERDGAVAGYRPLGGGVEFGERAADAVVREFREETGRAVAVVELIEVSENLFTYEGRPGHEIVFLFHVRFAPGDEPADLDLVGYVEPGEPPRDAIWLPLAEVLGGMHTVYPAGFAEILARWIGRM